MEQNTKMGVLAEMAAIDLAFRAWPTRREKYIQTLMAQDARWTYNGARAAVQVCCMLFGTNPLEQSPEDWKQD